MAMAEPRKVLIDPLIDNNPVMLQVLGICSALARGNVGIHDQPDP
jgi:Na+-transporting NADH:ubiquinone oxidoreductase subunit D